MGHPEVFNEYFETLKTSGCQSKTVKIPQILSKLETPQQPAKTQNEKLTVEDIIQVLEQPTASAAVSLKPATHLRIALPRSQYSHAPLRHHLDNPHILSGSVEALLRLAVHSVAEWEHFPSFHVAEFALGEGNQVRTASGVALAEFGSRVGGMVAPRKVVSEDGGGGPVTRRLDGAAFGRSRGLVPRPAKGPDWFLVVVEIEDWGIVAVATTALVEWRWMGRQDRLIGVRLTIPCRVCRCGGGRLAH